MPPGFDEKKILQIIYHLKTYYLYRKALFQHCMKSWNLAEEYYGEERLSS